MSEVSLIDLVPVTETVTVAGKEIVAGAVESGALIAMIFRFPEFRGVIDSRDDGKGGASFNLDLKRLSTLFSPESLMTMGGTVTSALIAAGCGFAGNKKAETIAGQLSLEEQAELLAAVLRRSMPNGPVPFVEKLTQIIGRHLPSAEVKPAVSPEGGYRVRVKRSPSPSMNSEATATH